MSDSNVDLTYMKAKKSLFSHNFSCIVVIRSNYFPMYPQKIPQTKENLIFPRNELKLSKLKMRNKPFPLEIMSISFDVYHSFSAILVLL